MNRWKSRRIMAGWVGSNGVLAHSLFISLFLFSGIRMLGVLLERDRERERSGLDCSSPDILMTQLITNKTSPPSNTSYMI